MAVTVKIEQQLSKQMREALQTLRRLQLKKPLEAVGQEIVSQTQERITQEQAAPDGTPWVDWSDPYEKRVAKRGYGAFLDAEGELIGSLNYAFEGDELLVGSPLDYAATHQFGDESRGIVARPFLGINRRNEKDLLNVMSQAINTELEKMGL